MRILVIILFLCLCPLVTYAIVADGWDIRIEAPTVTSKLIKEQEMQTYTGEMTTVQLERIPRKGYVYVLVPLQAVRISKDKTPIQIGKVRLKQGDKIFERVTDDSFLIDYDILPFTSFSVNQEKCKGTLLFEIPLRKDDTKSSSILYKMQVIQTL